MRAVICQEASLRVEDVPEPRPERGQVLLSVTRCGICGSDLHARTGCDDLAPVMGTVGYERFMRSHEPVVFGHEFTGEVLEYGSGCREDVAAGTPVVALPIVRWN